MSKAINDATVAIRIALLVHKQKEREVLTAEEEQWLQQWLLQDDANQRVWQQLQDRDALVQAVHQLQQYDKETAWQSLSAALQLPQAVPQPGRLYRMRWALTAAAAVLVVAVGLTWWMVNTRKAAPVITKAETRYHNDVAPGTDKAVLTLADGSTIVLDSSRTGTLAQQGNVQIIQQDDHLIYESKGAEQAVSYNTMTTPRGGRFMIWLPDGSKVWLNAASSIRYPTAFTGSERIVEMTGEAYFEVKSQPTQPFVVKFKDTRVRVLGTHFNVMAYQQETESHTTLIEGLVQMEKGAETLLLHPGQQARVQVSMNKELNPDIEEVLAWKNGRFHFGETISIATVMRQIADWYDVEVVFHGAIDRHVGGSVSRTATLEHLLKVLEATGVVHFAVEGKRVDVYPSN